MEIDEEQARLIHRALVTTMSKLNGELGRILQSDESDYIKEAATKAYNVDAEGYSTLHIALCEAFPALTQR